MRLTDRHVLVTGAASGIGLAIAQLFEAEGARLALVARHDTELPALRERLARPDEHVLLAGDLADADAATDRVDRAAAHLGALDGVVHSAGRDLVASIAETTPEDFDGLFADNLRSAYLVCRAALAHLRAAKRSTIVTLASGAALRPLAERSAYCASKAALVMFTKTLALECAADGVRANALCPGAVDTPMLRATAGGDHGDPVPDDILARFALGRIGEPGEIARAALFLTSDDSSFVTGAALAADGGRTFH